MSHACRIRKRLEFDAVANRVEPAMTAQSVVRQVSGLDRLTHQLQATLVIAATRQEQPVDEQRLRISQSGRGSL